MWYAGIRLLKTKTEFIEKNSNGTLLWTILSSRTERLVDYFDFDVNMILYVFICYLVEHKAPQIFTISEILCHEYLVENNNKYGLTKVNDAKFLRQGFVLNDIYYLYNIFFDTSIGEPIAEMPLTLSLIKNISSKPDLYLRCDRNLAVLYSEYFSTASTDFQKYRGITMDFSNIEALVSKKEIVVHFHAETQNKVLMTIKPDNDPIGNRLFYHITIEQLWNPDNLYDDIIITNFIHSKFYTDKKAFEHIDFAVNQYDYSVFTRKYIDAVTATTIPIDKYGEYHYKIWCVEGSDITINDWSNLVYATLDTPFRDTFLEMFKVE